MDQHARVREDTSTLTDVQSILQTALFSYFTRWWDGASKLAHLPQHPVCKCCIMFFSVFFFIVFFFFTNTEFFILKFFCIYILGYGPKNKKIKLTKHWNKNGSTKKRKEKKSWTKYCTLQMGNSQFVGCVTSKCHYCPFCWWVEVRSWVLGSNPDPFCQLHSIP